MSEAGRAISVLVHGPSKAGKSTLAVTSPYPRLLMDCESGHRFLPIRVKKWDPKTEDPPVPDGTWDTCVVNCQDWATMMRTYQWLQIGKHHFASVIIDSLSELQTRCLESIAGRGQMQQQQWGELLRAFAGFMRDMRDLTEHPTKPLQAVVLTAMSQEHDGRMKPYLQGKSGTVAPYFFDICGYITQETFAHPDPTQPPYKVRRMHIERSDRWEAGERVQGRLGTVVEQADLSIETMLDKVFGARPTPDAAPAAASQATTTTAPEPVPAQAQATSDAATADVAPF